MKPVDLRQLCPEQRFSSRAEDYAKYRPSYPDELLDWIELNCGALIGKSVAEIGAGTGIMSQLLADRQADVIAVEPNDAMRQVGEAFTNRMPKVSWQNGRSECTGLSKQSVDLWLAAQAFHWFDPAATAIEARRILRKPGWAVICSNDRMPPFGGFDLAYETMLERWCVDYGKIRSAYLSPPSLLAFFGTSSFEQAKFQHQQSLTWEQLIGRLQSCSYVPLPAEKNYGPLMADAQAAFERWQADGMVQLEYDCRVVLGRVFDLR